MKRIVGDRNAVEGLTERIEGMKGIITAAIRNKESNIKLIEIENEKEKDAFKRLINVQDSTR